MKIIIVLLSLSSSLISNSSTEDCFQEYMQQNAGMALSNIGIKGLKKITFRNFDEVKIIESSQENMNLEFSVEGNGCYQVLRHVGRNKWIFYPQRIVQKQSEKIESRTKMIVNVPSRYRTIIRVKRSTCCSIL